MSKQTVGGFVLGSFISAIIGIGVFFKIKGLIGFGTILFMICLIIFLIDSLGEDW